MNQPGIVLSLIVICFHDLYIYSINKNIIYDYLWISYLFNFLDLLLIIINNCVMGYFYTFIYCWSSSLNSLNLLVSNYIDFLGLMVLYLCSWPNNIIFLLGANSVLFWVYKMLHFRPFSPNLCNGL